MLTTKEPDRTAHPSNAMWHRPRKLIGFDLIKGLRDLSRNCTGGRHTFDACAVQRDQDGMIAQDINLTALRPAWSPQELTYKQLCKMAAREAQEIATRLMAMPENTRFSRLSGLVEEAHRDGYKAWTLSSTALRRLIFPQSYNAQGRCDFVTYRADHKDGACGKQVHLKSLSPQHIHHFLTHAQQMCPTINPDIITPINAK